MKATCRCGGEWECVFGKAIKCLKCGTVDKTEMAAVELSVKEDFTSLPPDCLVTPVLSPQFGSGQTLTTIGHIVKSLENGSNALRSALIDKNMPHEFIEAAKTLEHEAYNLRRRLEEHARKTGSQLYMLS